MSICQNSSTCQRFFFYLKLANDGIKLRVLQFIWEKTTWKNLYDLYYIFKVTFITFYLAKYSRKFSIPIGIIDHHYLLQMYMAHSSNIPDMELSIPTNCSKSFLRCIDEKLLVVVDLRILRMTMKKNPAQRSKGIQLFIHSKLEPFTLHTLIIYLYHVIFLMIKQVYIVYYYYFILTT